MRRRLILVVITIPVLIALLLAVYNLRAYQLLQRHPEGIAMDPQTGYLTGTGPVTLRPDGEPRAAVLMVHGFISSPQDFNELGERLRDQGVLVRKMTLPGHGTDPRELKTVTADELSAAVMAEYQALRAEGMPVYLCGFSMGGALSIIAAAQEPPDGLVLLAPYFRVRRRWFYVLTPETWNHIMHPVIPWIVKWGLVKGVNDPEGRGKNYHYHVAPTKFVLQLDKVGRRAKDGATLSRVTCPVLMFVGADDDTASSDIALEHFERLGTPANKREVVTLARSKHIICWDYDKEEVYRRTAEFVGR